MGQLWVLESAEQVVFENLKRPGSGGELGTLAVAIWLFRTALKLQLRSGSFHCSGQNVLGVAVRRPGWRAMGASPGYFKV